MNYDVQSDEDILINIAESIERIRISKQIKEVDLAKRSGVSRKSYYNFKMGTTAFSLKNLIRIMRSLGELKRLEKTFNDIYDYSPRNEAIMTVSENHQKKRVRNSKKEESDFKWGDEK